MVFVLHLKDLACVMCQSKSWTFEIKRTRRSLAMRTNGIYACHISAAIACITLRGLVAFCNQVLDVAWTHCMQCLSPVAPEQRI